MQLAVNYSPQAAALLDEGQIDFDLYKTTEWPSMIAEATRQRPAYVHFKMLAGRRDIADTGWDVIEARLADTVTPYVNTHLAPRAADFGVPLESADPLIGEQMMAAMQRDIAEMVARVGAERVILENANYDPNYDIPIWVIRPPNLRRAVEESGCGLLLDLGHAKMSAAYFGVDVHEYIEQLPLHALKELHVAGTRYVEAERRLVDHYPMADDDWALAEWALGHIHRGDWPRPWVVALEYGGTGKAFAWRSDPAVLRVDVPRLHRLVYP
jgi:uncharacterized protein (UPF0276 family)